MPGAATSAARWVVLGAALLLASPAAAFDPTLPVLGEEPPAEAKLEQFAQAYADMPEVRAALKAAADAPPRDRIHRALAALPAYAAASRAFLQTGDNADAWRPLAAGVQERFLRAHATYFLGRALLAQDDLPGAAQALEEVRGRLRASTPYTDEATLYLAYVYARANELKDGGGAGQRTRARVLLETLVPGPKALYRPPERVVEGAVWLLRELRGEGMGPLLELAKRMETIERRIRRDQTGAATQDRQGQVVAAIDRLIELMRDKQQQGGGQGEGGGEGKQGGQQQGGQKQQQGQQQQGQPKPSQQGAQESTRRSGSDNGGELADGARHADLDGWADMRERERDEAVQLLRERFPAQYRELIERYYRALAEQDR